jgi:hypothetical protein
MPKLCLQNGSCRHFGMRFAFPPSLCKLRLSATAWTSNVAANFQLQDISALQRKLIGLNKIWRKFRQTVGSHRKIKEHKVDSKKLSETSEHWESLCISSFPLERDYFIIYCPMCNLLKILLLCVEITIWLYEKEKCVRFILPFVAWFLIQWSRISHKNAGDGRTLLTGVVISS